MGRVTTAQGPSTGLPSQRRDPWGGPVGVAEFTEQQLRNRWKGGSKHYGTVAHPQMPAWESGQPDWDPFVGLAKVTSLSRHHWLCL